MARRTWTRRTPQQRLLGAGLALTVAVGTLGMVEPLARGAEAQVADEIVVDGQDTGRVYYGVGAISAGASTRLLFDYPEPERSQILDYLFEPGYGASMQLLKVEIGGDTNSTDGSEASHMREPDVVDCDRGYEWWLMAEAKARNPDIKLAGLQWGAPGWFEGGGGGSSPPTTSTTCWRGSTAPRSTASRSTTWAAGTSAATTSNG